VDPDERKKEQFFFSLGTDIHYSTLLKIKEPKVFVVVVAVMQNISDSPKNLSENCEHL